jgi:hypothetical protein
LKSAAILAESSKCAWLAAYCFVHFLFMFAINEQTEELNKCLAAIVKENKKTGEIYFS